MTKKFQKLKKLESLADDFDEQPQQKKRTSNKHESQNTHTRLEKNPVKDKTFDIFEETEFFDSINKQCEYEKMTAKDKNWKQVELSDTDRMASEGVTGLDILDADSIGDYDAFIQSLISESVNNNANEGDANDEDNESVTTKKKKKKNKKKKQQSTDAAATTTATDSNAMDTTNDEVPAKSTSASTDSEATTTSKKKKKKNNKRKRDEMEKETSDASSDKSNTQTTTTTEHKALKPITAWAGMGIETGILQCIQQLEFVEPTPIQKESIPLALESKNIVAAAETGSGKTLAFAIPVINGLLKARIKAEQTTTEENTKEALLQCLILAPTRELASQVSAHIRNIIPKNNEKYTENLRIINIFGGMSEAKQQRQMNSHPHIIVATPGRFYEFLNNGFEFLTHMHGLKYLIIDEADRMFANGHFPELTRILTHIDDRREAYAKREKIELPAYQKFVSSATMTLEPDVASGRRVAANAQLGQLLDVMKMDDYELVDVLKDTKLAKTLLDAQIQCSDDEGKLITLYYFLQFYPGRTLIFTNTIKKARVIHSLFRTVFGMTNVNILHGEMQQRARLKNLDRFSGVLGKQGDNTVLIATDIAARGLDIPDVKHVIHFQLPTQTDVYIHRCGRTGRAQKEGLSLALVSQDDKKAHHALVEKLYPDKKELDEFPLTNHYYNVLPHLRTRVKLGLQIELKYRKGKMRQNDKAWFKQNADEMDIELDGTFFPEYQESDEELEDVDLELVNLKKQLDKAMDQRLPEPVDKRALARSFVTTDDSTFNTVATAMPKQDALKELKDTRIVEPATKTSTDTEQPTKKKKKRNKRPNQRRKLNENQE
jgi:ATP-dependent RNA helicase DDX24/MAK5